MVGPGPNPEWLASEPVLLTICCSVNTGEDIISAAPSVLSGKLDLKTGIISKFISRTNWMGVTNNISSILLVTGIQYKGCIFHVFVYM